MKIYPILLFVMSQLIAGCANLTTSTKDSALTPIPEDDSYENENLTVADIEKLMTEEPTAFGGPTRAQWRDDDYEYPNLITY